MTTPWPFPEHTVQDRDRFVCQVFREALQRADPDAAAAVDEFLKQFNHNFGWLFAPPTPSADVMSRNDVAQYHGVHPDTVSKWAERGHLARVPGGYLRTEVEAFEPGTGRRRTAARARQLDL